MKFGIDIHGVADYKRKFFSTFSKRAIENGHEIYIITGSLLTPKLIYYLLDIDMKWSYIFSVADYLIDQGVECRFSSPDNPWFPDDDWNRAKGEFCKMEGINLHFDDSKTYSKYFNTPYIFVGKQE